MSKNFLETDRCRETIKEIEQLLFKFFAVVCAVSAGAVLHQYRFNDASSQLMVFSASIVKWSLYGMGIYFITRLIRLMSDMFVHVGDSPRRSIRSKPSSNKRHRQFYDSARYILAIIMALMCLVIMVQIGDKADVIVEFYNAKIEETAASGQDQHPPSKDHTSSLSSHGPQDQPQRSQERQHSQEGSPPSCE